MRKYVNMTKFFGGGVLLTADSHPPPACRQANEKPNSKQEGE